ncbi:MAG: hypothetical protein Ta2A_24430 [Treponemataceae bacterium]|nr:MAG: hypothetical protein Ta2A_24430 [Treponemataceae bacterium]
MKYTDAQLKRAIEKKVFSAAQVDDFRKMARAPDSARSTGGISALTAASAVTALAAMTWLTASSYGTFGVKALAFFAGLYALALYAAGWLLFSRTRFAGGAQIVSALAVVAVGAFLCALLKAFGIWESAPAPLQKIAQKIAISGIPDMADISDMPASESGYDFWQHGRYIVMEIGALLAAVPLLAKPKFPVAAFLAALALWLFSMDIASAWFLERSLTLADRAALSRVFGVCAIAVGIWCAQKVDAKTGTHFAFPLYVFGSFLLLAAFSVFSSAQGLVSISPAVIVLHGSLRLCALAVFFAALALVLTAPNIGALFLLFALLALAEALLRGATAFFVHSQFLPPKFLPLVVLALALATVALGILIVKNRTKIDSALQSIRTKVHTKIRTKVSTKFSKMPNSPTPPSSSNKKTGGKKINTIIAGIFGRIFGIGKRIAEFCKKILGSGQKLKGVAKNFFKNLSSKRSSSY